MFCILMIEKSNLCAWRAWWTILSRLGLQFIQYEIYKRSTRSLISTISRPTWRITRYRVALLMYTNNMIQLAPANLTFAKSKQIFGKKSFNTSHTVNSSLDSINFGGRGRFTSFIGVTVFSVLIIITKYNVTNTFNICI